MNHATLVSMPDGHGWQRCATGDVQLWLKDVVEGHDAAELVAELARATVTSSWLSRWLAGLHGHFALIATGPSWALAAVDRVRSTPLFFAPASFPVRISAHAPSLAEDLELTSEADIEPDGALAVAMSGYTVGGDTLYRAIRQLRAGEALLVDPAGTTTLRYHLYRPWQARGRRSVEEMEEELSEVTLDILRRTIAFAGNRTIAVPLSAGMDSRLIASGLVHLGYRNLVCFTYGQEGSHEVAAAQAIAARLNVPWTYVPYTHQGQRQYFASDLHRRYVAFADSCASSPSVQDLPVLHRLLDSGWLPADAIVVNGQSGDFIAGGHIPANALGSGTAEDKWRRQFGAYTKKHLSLWDELKVPANLTRMEARLRRELDEIGLWFDAPEGDHGIYEFLEFQDRQCKYVISGQRVYEFLGLGWRLPLWDDAYLDFWETVPLEAKLGESLYRTMLERRNWGGVWRNLPINRRWPSPRWLVPIRLALKSAHMPLGRERWHRFERQYLHYWMSPTCNYATLPYWKVALDRRGHRNGVSYLTESYLRLHRRAYDGSAIAA